MNKPSPWQAAYGAAALLLGLPAVAQADPAQYQSRCAACHQPGGQGISGAFPKLAGNNLVIAPDGVEAIRTVLKGRGGMPAFAALLDDDTLAQILTYIRQSWGNAAPPVDAASVASIRKTLPAVARKDIGN